LLNRICYIHAGHSKTGTTAIQNTLHASESRAWLRERGYVYPSFGPNHLGLAARIENDPGRWLRYMSKAEFDQISTDQGAIESFSAEIAEWPRHHFILSSEHFQILSVDGLCRLRSFLEDYFGGFQVIVYVRHPVDFARSDLQNLVRAGVTTIDAATNTMPVLDFQILLEKWCAVFGKESVRVRSYDPKRFRSVSLVSDFLGTVSSELCELPHRTSIFNVSLSHCATLVANDLVRIRPRLSGDRTGTYQRELNQLLSSLEGSSFELTPELYSRVEREAATGLDYLYREFGLRLEPERPAAGRLPECDSKFVASLAKVIDEVVCGRCSADVRRSFASPGMPKLATRAIRKLRRLFLRAS